MERNVVSADVAEAKGELVGFRGIVAVLSWSGRKGNDGSWGKSGNDCWGRNLRGSVGGVYVGGLTTGMIGLGGVTVGTLMT